MVEPLNSIRNGDIYLVYPLSLAELPWQSPQKRKKPQSAISTMVIQRYRSVLSATIWTLFGARSTAPFVTAFAAASGQSPLLAPPHSTRRSMTARTTLAADNDATSCQESTTASGAANPLLADWSTQAFNFPPFALIEPSHFAEALQEGMKAHKADLAAIVSTTEAASFDNTIAAYDRAGHLLDRVSAVYGNLCSSKNTQEMKVVQTSMTPLLSRHRSETNQFPGLFARIQSVFAQTQQKKDSCDLSAEQVRLVERIHMDFTRAGAALDDDLQQELADLQAALASLATQFSQNVMTDEETYELVLTRNDLEGCPDFLLEAARTAAQERNKGEDDYVITLSRSLVEPFLTFADRRDLREQAWKAWISRGELSPERDNLAIATKTLALRKRVAEIHGYPSFAAYQCADRMAKTPEAVMELLENVWGRAKKSADGERKSMEEFVKESGMELEGGIEAYDWRYIAEKVRKAKYDFDESLLKPYLSLENVREALFAVSSNLFGLTYKKRTDIETYHPDVDVYEVHETIADGTDRLVSLFIHDNFARPFKSSGAWMSEYRSQTRNLGDMDPVEGIPIVSNNNNFAKSNKQTLLSYDDATTMFHEAGHGHHGMVSARTERTLL